MSLSSTTSRVDYTGDNSTVVFPYTFQIDLNTDLLVTLRSTAGVESTQILTTHYTVSSVGSVSGGNVTFITAPGTGVAITIRRVPPNTQTTDIRNQGRYYPEVHETAFDKFVKQVQNLQDELNRCLQLMETEAGTSLKTTLPTVANRASKYLAFDASGNPIASSTITGGTSASAFIQTVLDDADAATARNTLGVRTRLFQARLTLTTAVPITTSDVTAATTIFLTPYKGDIITLWNGTFWQDYTLTQQSIAVPATTNQMYDIFVFASGGTPTLELLAWTNDTTRATGVTLQDGVYAKSGDKTRLYGGSFRTTGVSGQTEDSVIKRYLWNYYNRILRKMQRVEATSSWAYTTAAFRQANGSSANQLDFVIGIAEDQIKAFVLSIASNSTINVFMAPGIGVDSTTANTATLRGGTQSYVSGYFTVMHAQIIDAIGIGRHFLAWLEYSAATGTTTWYGDASAPNQQQSGIMGEIWS